VVKKGVVHCPEGRQLFPKMSIHDNLLMGSFLRKEKDQIKEDFHRVYALFPILFERRRQQAGTLSGGEQQMLAIGRALMSSPRILMLDEPSLGLAPLVIEHIFDVITRLNREGLTTLLVEQNASLALEIADRTYVLEEGLITGEGDSKKLSSDPKIRETYLGIAG
jgi:branched-chain amino acid transport system ATP-binding protein